MMSKALERRAKLRQALIEASEQAIAAKGLSGLKTRDLARQIGCANGAVYNLVEDIDELILRVGSRTLRRHRAVAAFASRPAGSIHRCLRPDYRPRHWRSRSGAPGRGSSGLIIPLRRSPARTPRSAPAAILRVVPML